MPYFSNDLIIHNINIYCIDWFYRSTGAQLSYNSASVATDIVREETKKTWQKYYLEVQWKDFLWNVGPKVKKEMRIELRRDEW